MSTTVKILIGVVVAGALGAGGWFGYRAWKGRKASPSVGATGNVAATVKAAAPRPAAAVRPAAPPPAPKPPPNKPPADRGVTPAPPASGPSDSWNAAGGAAKLAINTIGGGLLAGLGVPPQITGAVGGMLVDGIGGLLAGAGIKF